MGCQIQKSRRQVTTTLTITGSEWGTGNATFDADGDGRMTVLDLQYVNVGSGGQ